LTKPEGVKVQNEPIEEKQTIDEVQPSVSEPEQKEEKLAEKEDKAIDEYGNPVEKPKVYSEEEVNRIVRERLSRGRQVEQPSLQSAPQQQIQSQPEEDNWEQQLEAFVEKTIDRRQQKLTEQQWRQQEAARQVEFESKFSSGMSGYSDFQNVVSGKPITDSMMLATRSLDNPAAFIYGAAKFHAQDLDRISKINDPYAQASEMGRLHEKMVKSSKVISSAPKPIEAVSGDMPSKKTSEYPPLDERIHQYAKQKRK
jgi:hypothetical protein